MPEKNVLSCCRHLSTLSQYNHIQLYNVTEYDSLQQCLGFYCNETENILHIMCIKSKVVIQTLQKNASNAQNMIKEVIKTFKDFSIDKDPANNCLDTAIITDPKLRTKKTIKKLKYIAGRALNKK